MRGNGGYMVNAQAHMRQATALKPSGEDRADRSDDADHWWGGRRIASIVPRGLACRTWHVTPKPFQLRFDEIRTHRTANPPGRPGAQSRALRFKLTSSGSLGTVDHITLCVRTSAPAVPDDDVRVRRWRRDQWHVLAAQNVHARAERISAAGLDRAGKPPCGWQGPIHPLICSAPNGPLLMMG